MPKPKELSKAELLMMAKCMCELNPATEEVASFVMIAHFHEHGQCGDGIQAVAIAGNPNETASLLHEGLKWVMTHD